MVPLPRGFLFFSRSLWERRVTALSRWERVRWRVLREIGLNQRPFAVQAGPSLSGYAAGLSGEGEANQNSHPALGRPLKSAWSKKSSAGFGRRGPTFPEQLAHIAARNGPDSFLGLRTEMGRIGAWAIGNDGSGFPPTHLREKFF